VHNQRIRLDHLHGPSGVINTFSAGQLRRAEVRQQRHVRGQLPQGFIQP